MAYYKQTTDLDLGETSIENIFINDFMPMADGTAVKVYLLAFQHAKDQNHKFNHEKLAKHLNIPLADVFRSWDFWESKGIIKKIPIGDTYDVEFLSLRQLIAKSIYGSQKKVTEQAKSNINILEANKNPEIRKMFYTIDQLMRRQLVPHERNIVLDWLYKQNISIELIERAFRYSIEERGVNNLKYVGSVLIGWHDQGILTEADLEEHFAKRESNYLSYKQVYQTLGYSNKLPSAGDKELIDKWLEEYGYDMEFIITVLKNASTRTNNINMNYMHKVMENLHNNSISTIEAYDAYIQDRTKKKSTPKKATSNKFHNFKQRDKKYTNEELEKKLGIRK